MSENENSARPRCDFIYTKNSARPRSDFIYTKNFQEGRCDRKWRFYNKETAFAGGTKFGLRWCEIHVLRVRFLCGNPRLVAFQIGNGTVLFPVVVRAAVGSSRKSKS